MRYSISLPVAATALLVLLLLAVSKPEARDARSSRKAPAVVRPRVKPVRGLHTPVGIFSPGFFMRRAYRKTG